MLGAAQAVEEGPGFGSLPGQTKNSKNKGDMNRATKKNRGRFL